MTASNTSLAERTWRTEVTKEEINGATKEKLDELDAHGYTLLYSACKNSSIEIIETILDKDVDIDAQSGEVSILMTYDILPIINT
jgi:hypothetical protein